MSSVFYRTFEQQGLMSDGRYHIITGGATRPFTDEYGWDFTRREVHRELLGGLFPGLERFIPRNLEQLQQGWDDSGRKLLDHEEGHFVFDPLAWYAQDPLQGARLWVITDLVVSREGLWVDSLTLQYEHMGEDDGPPNYRVRRALPEGNTHSAGDVQCGLIVNSIKTLKLLEERGQTALCQEILTSLNA